jgi:N-acetylmuramoyl-L-alanine amidase
MRICLDPGHNCPPKDIGAEDILNEQEVVKDIAYELEQILIMRGHSVMRTRAVKGGSVTASLRERCEASNDFRADLFISLHCNANEHTSHAMGVETYAAGEAAMRTAKSIESSISSLGFKSRGAKDGDWLYVLTHTAAKAILIECFFVDSVADCELYSQIGAKKMALAIADGIGGKAAPKPAATTIAAPTALVAGRKQLVREILKACDTGLARGLSRQLIAKLNRMVKSAILVEVSHPLIDIGDNAVNAYLQPAAATALIKAVEQRGVRLKINSCLRTTIQQHLIKRQCANGLCGIPAAAAPGRSNHEQGRAIDIEDPYKWQPFLENHGWSKLGDWDRMHFDFHDGRTDVASLQITAFQQLWNYHNPDHQIAVDGHYGEITGEKIDSSPIGGW